MPVTAPAGPATGTGTVVHWPPLQCASTGIPGALSPTTQIPAAAAARNALSCGPGPPESCKPKDTPAGPGTVCQAPSAYRCTPADVSAHTPAVREATSPYTTWPSPAIAGAQDRPFQSITAGPPGIAVAELCWVDAHESPARLATHTSEIGRAHV